MVESSKKQKIIVVGANNPYGDSVPWSQINLRNFVDIDVAILIFRNLATESRALNGIVIHEMKGQLQRLLQSQGKLIVVTPGICQFTVQQFPKAAVQIQQSIHDVIPVPITIRSEKGDTVIQQEKMEFTSYLKLVKDWKFWAESTGTGAAEVPFLCNREFKTLAGNFRSNRLGLTLLPDVPKLSTDEIALALLSEIGAAEPETPPPDWTCGVSVPGLDKINSDISACESRIESEENSLNRLVEARQKLEKYKGLVYATGDQLEALVEDVLAQLGVDLLDERHGVEDLLGKIGDELCVIEVTGMDGPLKLLKVRQLLDHAMIVEDQAEERPKAILVANPLRLVPLDKRDKAKTPEFPSNVVTRAEETKIAIVPGRWLFDRYCEFLAKKIDGATILQQIVDADGVVE